MPAPAEPITVVFLAGTPLLGAGFASLMQDRPEVSVVANVTSASELTETVERLEPQVVVLSLVASAPESLELLAAARELRKSRPSLGLLVVTDAVDGLALTLLRGGAHGTGLLVRDHIDDLGSLITAIADVAAGRTVLDPHAANALIQRSDAPGVDDLTTRESEVLEQIALGRSNRAIADELCLSMKSVEKHITAIFRKLDLVDRPAVDRRVMAALAYLRSEVGRSIAPGRGADDA